LQRSPSPGVVKTQGARAQQPLPLFSLEGKRKVSTHYGRSLYDWPKKVRRHSSAGLKTCIACCFGRFADSKIGGRTEVLQHMAPYLDFSAEKLLRRDLSREGHRAAPAPRKSDVAFTYIRPDSAELQAKRILQSKTHFAIHKICSRRKANSALIENPEFLLQTPCVAYTLRVIC